MTILQKNSTGEFNTIVRSPKSAPSFDRQKYKPKQYLFDADLNEWVSFYWVDVPFRGDNGGAQCMWLENNAEEDNEEEFGIKLTAQNIGDGKAKAAAFAMYQRQKAAAEAFCAPPVHGMCCFKYYNKENRSVTTYWGYLSCVAGSVGDIEECDDSMCEYNSYVTEQMHKWDKYDEISDLLDGMGIYSRSILNDIAGEIGSHPDDCNFHDWCDDNGYEQYNGKNNLYENLRNIDISHVQNDWHAIGILGCHRTMGGDLHASNMGYWNGELVCIDFGYHCVQ
jgi:hypothetical protein